MDVITVFVMVSIYLRRQMYQYLLSTHVLGNSKLVLMLVVRRGSTRY